GRLWRSSVSFSKTDGTPRQGSTSSPGELHSSGPFRVCSSRTTLAASAGHAGYSRRVTVA
ncbi:MAG: hypothetical protein VX311_02330, partial [Planctomycetota bacterium]|nr:hypothetical protein [Planctomycetota bacterium]